VVAVRSATDILALIGEYTPLKRIGRRYVGLCPFHAEKTGSFSVMAEEGLYYCSDARPPGTRSPSFGISRAATSSRQWSACGTSRIAVRHDTGGRTSPTAKDARRCSGSWSGRSRSTTKELLSQPGANVQGSTCGRGLRGRYVRQFTLGWAPEAGRSLVGAVRAPADLLVKAGLAHQGQNGLRDAFRGRVIFPIFDPTGKAIGLGGRILPGAGEGAGPKYRNSPETPIYSKRRTLYGPQLGQALHSSKRAK